MKQLYRLTAVLLLTVLLLGGCTTIGADTGWVYSHNGSQMPAGLYITYQIMAVGDAQDIIWQEGSSQEGFQMPATTKDLLKTTVEGTNAQAWIETRALEYVRLHYYIENLFAEMNLEQTERLQSVATYAAESAWAQSGTLLDANGISRASYELRALNDAKMQAIFEAWYGEGGEHEAPIEELRQQFKQDYVYADVISATKPTSMPEGSAKTVEDLTAEMRTMFEGYVTRAEAGESFEDIDYEFKLWQARENSLDESTVTKAEEGTLAVFISKEDSAYYRADFVTELKAVEPNAIKLVELDNAFYLVRAHDVLAEEGLFDLYRLTVLYDLKYEEFEQTLDAKAADVSLEANEKAVGRYKLSNLKIA